LKVNLVEDGQPNCLLYPHTQGCTVYSRPILGQYIEKVFKARYDHGDCEILKGMSSSLWGYLCEKVKYQFSADEVKGLPANYQINQ
jgi:hypothetical protein